MKSTIYQADAIPLRAVYQSSWNIGELPERSLMIGIVFGALLNRHNGSDYIQVRSDPFFHITEPGQAGGWMAPHHEQDSSARGTTGWRTILISALLGFPPGRCARLDRKGCGRWFDRIHFLFPYPIDDPVNFVLWVVTPLYFWEEESQRNECQDVLILK
ncbi:hypothetical protein NPIL_391881 [Nephila pilipes]|uniref:Uncharacterized protein n=1 Tax=Nephila pilipes TaxID=299642 RepID=A0A8X6N6F9_NEPPI|nr:hypothetical protein NPIL_391881 [Nephila pilipes]